VISYPVGIYADVMRYADGGGLTTTRGRAARERVRLQVAEMFEKQLHTGDVAARLRVRTKSVCAWRRAWTAGGRAGLASRGPGGAVCKLDDAQLDRLTDELDRGPAVQQWADWAGDQRWTLARVATLIHRLFGVSYTLRGVSYLLHRIGWTPQVPARRAVERDADAIAAWRAVSGATPAPTSRP
jgi:transposase